MKCHLVLSITGIFLLCPSGFSQTQEDSFLRNVPVLTLQELLVRGVEENLDVKLERMEAAIEEKDVEFFSAEFDPALESSLSSSERRNPSSSSLTAGGHNITRDSRGELALRKRFSTGLESRMAVNSSRSTNNSRTDALRPQYRSQIVLNLTQPLLRDFGTKVNTTDILLSQNEVVQAMYAYQDRALRVAEEIEVTYFDLAEAAALYQFRIDSQKLAEQLLEGNQLKFESGLAPISEVQEAETALASRRELIISARQQVELVLNRLRDLLEITSSDPLAEQPFITPPIEEFTPSEETLDDALQVALENRPDIKRLRSEIENWDIRLQYYKNQKLPRLDLQATLGFNGLAGKARNIPDLGQDFQTANPHIGDYFDSFGHLVEGEGVEWFIGVQMSYPLGNRAANARYEQTDLQKVQALTRLKQLEQTIETEIRNALTVIQRSGERVKVAQEFQELADRSLAQENELFTQGLSDTFRLLDFQDDVIDARIRKISALVDYHQGWANFYQALGTNLKRFGITLATNNQTPQDEGLLDAK